MKRSPTSLIQLFTFLLTSIVLCFIILSLISSRGIDRVGGQFDQLSLKMLPSALSNATLTQNVLQQVKFMNDGLHSVDLQSLGETQTLIENYQRRAKTEIQKIKQSIEESNTIFTASQIQQLSGYIHQLDAQSNTILTIQKNILSLNQNITEKLPSLRYGLSSIGPEMSRISHFLIIDNPEADDAVNRFVSSAIALESTFLMLMAEENSDKAKASYNEIYNRTAALDLAFDNLSTIYPDISTYMSLIAPLDIVMNELKEKQAVPRLIINKLSLVKKQKHLIGIASNTSLTVTSLLSTISSNIEYAMQQRSVAVSHSIESFKKTILLISSLLIIMLWAAAVGIRSWMSKGLNNIITHLKYLADHNYQHNAPETGPTEMQLIARKLNKVMASTTHSIHTMSENCDSLYQTSEISKSVSNDIEEGLCQQNESLSSMTDIVEQLELSISEIAQLTQESHQETNTATQAAKNGLTVISNNNQRLTALNNALSQNVAAMNTLDTQVEKIQTMVGVIANLADNTNLLALNAAIEAARAGEQGRGFAVVADEVRELAGSTSKQTNNIRDTMHALLNAADEAKASIALSQTEMSLSLESSIEVSHTFEHISTSVTDISDRISQVSVATEQQAQAATEVSNNINHINQHGEDMALQLSAFVESTEQVATIASDQKLLITTYRL